MDTQISSNSVNLREGKWRRVQTRSPVFARVSHSTRPPRKHLYVKAIITLSTRNDWIWDTVAVVKKTNYVTEAPASWDKVQHRKGESLEPSCFPQRHTDMLKQNFTILKNFGDPCEHYEGRSTALTSWIFSVLTLQRTLKFFSCLCFLSKTIKRKVGPTFLKLHLQRSRRLNFKALQTLRN